MTTLTTANADETGSAPSSPDRRTNDAVARRFASYVGYASTGFSWGPAKYLRRGDVLEVQQDDYRLKTQLANVSIDRKDWTEVDVDFVLSELVFCENCQTWRSPIQVEDHLKTIHERLLGGQPRVELTQIQAKIAAKNTEIKQLQKDKADLTAEASVRINQLRDLGLWKD